MRIGATHTCYLLAGESAGEPHLDASRRVAPIRQDRQRNLPIGMAVEAIVRGDGSEDRLLVVSVDSHAQAPPHAWPEYLERRYQEYLPALNEDNEVYTTVMAAMSYPITGSPEMRRVYDLGGAQGGGGLRGIWDADVRLGEMDREGIAAEFVYFGDHRASAIFYNVFNRKYDNDVCEAGVRAYHRWLHDTFGHAQDRLFLVGAGGPGLDIEATIAELSWVADRGFRGTYAPGFLSYPGLRPLFDDYWEPVWRLCEERSLPLFVHAGFGQDQGRAFPEIAADQERSRCRRRNCRRSRGTNQARGAQGRLLRRRFTVPPDVAADVRRRIRPSSRSEAGYDRGASRLAAGDSPLPRPGVLAASLGASSQADAKRVLAHELPGLGVVPTSSRDGHALRNRPGDSGFRPGLSPQ